LAYPLGVADIFMDDPKFNDSSRNVAQKFTGKDNSVGETQIRK